MAMSCRAIGTAPLQDDWFKSSSCNHERRGLPDGAAANPVSSTQTSPRNRVPSLCGAMTPVELRDAESVLAQLSGWTEELQHAGAALGAGNAEPGRVPGGAAHDAENPSSAELVQKRSRLAQVAGGLSLAECGVDRRQRRVRIGSLPVAMKQPSETHRDPKLQRPLMSRAR